MAAVVSFDAQSLASHRRLVAGLAQGEVAALQVLYREHSAIVHGVVRRILPDAEDAREAVQDTFVRAWRQAASYRSSQGEVVAWLVFLARRAAIDRLRVRSRGRRLQERLEAEPPETVAPGADIFEYREELDQHLAQLTAPQRQALELAFFSGCSQAEIAAAMRTPIGNVKNHLRRGLLKLRQIVTTHD